MRQETGSNSQSGNNKVSIQVKLGGLSFSAESVAVTEGAEVEFVIETPRVILAPREEVSLDNADQLLALAGKPCRSNEQSVCSELQADIVAVMALDREALASIVERWGGRLSFSSPLLDMRHSDESCLTVDMGEKVCYIRHFDSGLRYARALECSTADDLLYYVAEVVQGRKELPIYIKGGEGAVKVLRRYFKRVICE